MQPFRLTSVYYQIAIMKRLLLSISILISISLCAQESPYYFSVSFDDYSALTESTSLNNGEIWDDPDHVIPIGFEFDFMGRIIEEFIMTSDFLGGGLMTMPDDDDTANVFFVYESDIIDAGYANGVSESNISYKLEGTEPNRIFKLEWDDCGFYNEYSEFGTSGNRVSFQLWVFEGTNNMEIHFGPNSIKNPDMVHSFTGAPIVALIQDVNFFTDELTGIFYCSGHPDDATLEASDNLDEVENATFLSADPQNGLIFRFGTSPVSVFEEEELDWVNVYPSHTRDRVYVNTILNDSQYAVYDAVGNLVANGILYKGLNTVDFSELVAGVYFIRTSSHDHHYTSRVFKQ